MPFQTLPKPAYPYRAKTTERMRTTDEEIVRRMETSNPKLRFVIPIECSMVGRLPKLVCVVYKVLLDARVRNMVHHFFERGMDLHDDHSKHAVVLSTTLVHMICSLDRSFRVRLCNDFCIAREGSSGIFALEGWFRFRSCQEPGFRGSDCRGPLKGSNARTHIL